MRESSHSEASEDGLAHFKDARGDVTARLPEHLEAAHELFWHEDPPKPPLGARNRPPLLENHRKTIENHHL